MAYPVYQYPNYTPYYAQPVPDQLAHLRQQQMMQPPVQQPPMQMQPSAAGQTGNGILWVGSKQEADNYPIAPGCAVALWDSNNPVIYLRQADSTGKPSTKVYDMVERQEGQAQQAQTPDLSQYVTWDKLEEYLTKRSKRRTKNNEQEETENG